MPEDHSSKTADAVDVALGQRIRILRSERGMSQNALADAAGVTFQQIQKYERGSNRVSASRMARIAKALGVRIGTLFGESESRRAQSILPELQTPGASEIVRLYAKASPNIRQKILALLQELVED